MIPDRQPRWEEDPAGAWEEGLAKQPEGPPTGEEDEEPEEARAEMPGRITHPDNTKSNTID